VSASGEREPCFDVFLSHSSRDKRLVERIAEWLKRAQLEPWLDTWRLVPGAAWQSGLAEGLAAARSCAVFVGPGDLGAWENQEVALALDRVTADPDFRLYLVLLPGVPEPFDAAGLSPFLRLRAWVDYRGGLDDERAFHGLVSAIKGVPPGTAVSIDAESDVCPYRCLEAFEDEHADFFFGRAADVQWLLEKVKGRRFLAVLGASGSG
jgi:TIR domain/Novel STAND NTPase 1